MTAELCKDVERLILKKAMNANEMMYAVYFNRQGSSDDCQMFHLTRNMLDPPWHIRIHIPMAFHENENKFKTFLCRNKEMLEHLIRSRMRTDRNEDILNVVDTDDEFEIFSQDFHFTIYSQDLLKPPFKLLKEIRKRTQILSVLSSKNSRSKIIRDIMKEIEIVIGTA
jgi:hypothetical protein